MALLTSGAALRPPRSVYRRSAPSGRPLKIRPEDLGCRPAVRFVSVATGRAHAALVVSSGACFSAGFNSNGQVSREAVCSSGKNGTY